MSNCSVCNDFITIADSESVTNQKFVTLMEFKKSKRSLKYFSSHVQCLLSNAEIYFKAVESNLSNLQSVREQLVNAMLKRDINVQLFPTCHNIASKLLNRFFTIRLHALSLKLLSLSSTVKPGSLMASKSAAMREAVKK